LNLFYDPPKKPIKKDSEYSEDVKPPPKKPPAKLKALPANKTAKKETESSSEEEAPAKKYAYLPSNSYRT
jgi:hypothetical protein